MDKENPPLDKFEPVEAQDGMKITRRFSGICGIHLKLLMEKPKYHTWNMMENIIDRISMLKIVIGL